MRNHESSPARYWPSTHWSQLAKASSEDDSTKLEALNQVVGRYQNALLAHLLFKFKMTECAAKDILQSFLLDRVLARDLFASARPDRGRFRNFLLRSLDNYALNVLRADSAAHRRPSGGFAAIEDLPGWDPVAPGDHPSAAFEMAWAVQVMEQARDAMRSECERSGRNDVWEVFSGRILGPLLHGHELLPYDQIVSRFGYRDPDQASNILVTGKRMFLRILREVVGAYVAGPEDVEAEMADLAAVLSRGRG